MSRLSPEKINIDFPRLIHGSYFRNVKKTFEEGVLDSTKGGEGISFPTTDALFFNVAGVPVECVFYGPDKLETTLRRVNPKVDAYLATVGKRTRFRDWVIDKAPGIIHPKFEEERIYEDEDVSVFFGGSTHAQHYYLDNELKRTALLVIKRKNGPKFDERTSLIRTLAQHQSCIGDGIAYDDVVRAELHSNPKNNGLRFLKEAIPERVWSEIERGLPVPSTFEELQSHAKLKHYGVDFFFLVDEQVMIEGLKDNIREKGVEAKTNNPTELRELIARHGYDLGQRWGSFPTYLINFLNPHGTAYLNYGEAVPLSLDHLEIIQALRRDPNFQITNDWQPHYQEVYDNPMTTQFREGCTAHGFYASYPVPLKYVVGIVLPRVEQKQVKKEDKPLPVTSTDEAIEFMRSFMTNHKIPIFDMEGTCLYTARD